MSLAATRRVLGWLDDGVVLLSRTGISQDFLRFGVVGVLGFCWDTATVYALRGLVGLYAAGAAGFFVAATLNWLVNRVWTYQHLKHGSAHRQWAKFLVANSIGFIFNRGTFFTLITVNALCRSQPVLPIICGSLAGLIFNYLLSKRFVFS